MNKPELIIMAGSAGSFHIIFDIIKKLPNQFLTPILVIMHRGKSQNIDIEEILSTNSNLEIKEIKDKDTIKEGSVYLCPPDYHLFIEKERIFSLDVSEPVLFSRPSIDLTLMSAAEVYKDKLVAILFSGANQDGAQGLLKIKNNGGTTIVQNPNVAEVKTMPLAALALNAATQTLNNQEIESLLFSFLS